MADYIYDQELEDVGAEIYINNTNTGWVLDDVRYGRDSMKMGVYKKVHEDGTIEYAVAFKGTSNIPNVKNDVQAYMSDSSIDMWDAIDYSSIFVSENKDAEITFVGHSKGGGEAIVAAAYNGRDALTFNAANFNFEAYGISDANGANITNYYIRGEILHKFIGTASIGRTVPLETVYSPKKYNLATLQNIAIIGAAIQNHGMDAVKNALKERDRI